MRRWGRPCGGVVDPTIVRDARFGDLTLTNVPDAGAGGRGDALLADAVASPPGVSGWIGWGGVVP